MLFWISWILIAMAGGVTQTLTGFGSALVMMLVVPYFLTVVKSAAVVSLVSGLLSVILVWQYRDRLQPKRVLFPLVCYLAASLSLLPFVQKIDLKLMGLLFGVFLTLLGLYYLFFSEKARIPDTPAATALCGFFSGVCAACFGVGGPLMSLLFLERFPEREDYNGNLQLLFVMTNLVNTAGRAVNGIFTADLLPIVLVGTAAVWGGEKIGLKLAGKISAAAFRRSVYITVTLSGVITLIQNL